MTDFEKDFIHEHGMSLGVTSIAYHTRMKPGGGCAMRFLPK